MAVILRQQHLGGLFKHMRQGRLAHCFGHDE